MLLRFYELTIERQLKAINIIKYKFIGKIKVDLVNLYKNSYYSLYHSDDLKAYVIKDYADIFGTSLAYKMFDFIIKIYNMGFYCMQPSHIDQFVESNKQIIDSRVLYIAEDYYYATEKENIIKL